MKRLYNLDLLRIASAISVFIFHSMIHIECTYGPFQAFFSQGAIFMILFFMLSGFTMFLHNNTTDLIQIKNMKNYFMKRLSALYPLYIVVGIIYELMTHSLTFKENVLLFPTETLMLQSSFTGLFNYTHNSGTWFISCLFFCILLSPFINSVFKQITVASSVVFCIVLCSISMYAPIVALYFNLPTIYSNPIFRIIEYIIGMAICKLYIHLESKVSKEKNILNLVVGIFLWIILFFSISYLQIKEIGDYRSYSVICIPLFAFILLITALHNKLYYSKAVKCVISYANSLCYPFFLAQFFVWKPMKYLEENTNIFQLYGNIKKITLSFVMCVAISIIFYELICKPCRKMVIKLIRTY